jgi:hypothetical protein
MVAGALEKRGGEAAGDRALTLLVDGLSRA